MVRSCQRDILQQSNFSVGHGYSPPIHHCWTLSRTIHWTLTCWAPKGFGFHQSTMTYQCSCLLYHWLLSHLLRPPGGGRLVLQPCTPLASAGNNDITHFSYLHPDLTDVGSGSRSEVINLALGLCQWGC
jgi:hypothetical protein